MLMTRYLFEPNSIKQSTQSHSAECRVALAVRRDAETSWDPPTFRVSNRRKRGRSSLNFRNQEPLPAKNRNKVFFFWKVGKKEWHCCVCVCVSPTKFPSVFQNSKGVFGVFSNNFPFPNSLPSTHQFNYKECSSILESVRKSEEKHLNTYTYTCGFKHMSYRFSLKSIYWNPTFTQFLPVKSHEFVLFPPLPDPRHKIFSAAPGPQIFFRSCPLPATK